MRQICEVNKCTFKEIKKFKGCRCNGGWNYRSFLQVERICDGFPLCYPSKRPGRAGRGGQGDLSAHLFLLLNLGKNSFSKKYLLWIIWFRACSKIKVFRGYRSSQSTVSITFSINPFQIGISFVCPSSYRDLYLSDIGGC